MVEAAPSICERLPVEALTALLDGPRARRAFVVRALFDGRWAISAEDEAALTVLVVTGGSAVALTGGEQHELRTGDVVLLRGPQRYVVADAPTTPVGIRILPGQVCVDLEGRLLDDSLDLGVRTWGTTRSPDATAMLIGTYERETSVGAHVLAHLPAATTIRGASIAAVGLLAAEMAEDGPGQQAVVDRLLDLVLIQALREVHTAGGLRGGAASEGDPAVARALALMHRLPERRWTVAALAAQAGLSRAAFARRFAAVVGEPPLTYLTRWRLSLAADLLVGTDLPLDAVAARVGYGTGFALSAAFTRVRGVSPSRFRAGQA